VIASQQDFCCDHVAPVSPAPDFVVTSFHRDRAFSGKKCRRKKPTLQLSSYVIDAHAFSHHEASFYAGFCRV